MYTHIWHMYMHCVSFCTNLFSCLALGWKTHKDTNRTYRQTDRPMAISRAHPCMHTRWHSHTKTHTHTQTHARARAHTGGHTKGICHNNSCLPCPQNPLSGLKPAYECAGGRLQRLDQLDVSVSPPLVLCCGTGCTACVALARTCADIETRTGCTIRIHTCINDSAISTSIYMYRWIYIYVYICIYKCVCVISERGFHL